MQKTSVYASIKLSPVSPSFAVLRCPAKGWIFGNLSFRFGPLLPAVSNPSSAASAIVNNAIKWFWSVGQAWNDSASIVNDFCSDSDGFPDDSAAFFGWVGCLELTQFNRIGKVISSAEEPFNNLGAHRASVGFYEFVAELSCRHETRSPAGPIVQPFSTENEAQGKKTAGYCSTSFSAFGDAREGREGFDERSIAQIEHFVQRKEAGLCTVMAQAHVVLSLGIYEIKDLL